MMKRTIASLLIVASLVCCKPNQLTALESAATVLCTGISAYEKYKDQLDMIQRQVLKKDYLAAAVLSKALYVEVVANGDSQYIPELVSLVSVLSNLASKAPLNEPDGGLVTQ